MDEGECVLLGDTRVDKSKGLVVEDMRLFENMELEEKGANGENKLLENTEMDEVLS